MANVKMTYAQAINFALQLLNENQFEGVEAEKAMAMERLEALKVQLAKRGSGSKHAPTKTQKENEGRKAVIVENLRTEDGGMTATEVGQSIGVSCQRASALLHQLMDEGKVEQVKEGKVVRFVAVD